MTSTIVPGTDSMRVKSRTTGLPGGSGGRITMPRSSRPPDRRADRRRSDDTRLRAAPEGGALERRLDRSANPIVERPRRVGAMRPSLIITKRKRACSYSRRTYSSTSRSGSCASADPTSAATIAARLFGERPGNTGPAVRDTT